ncbi:hypothetical protein M3629_26055, partial [Paenibacillus polysaccharolyticus]|uniref:hypothetical protein n=1 Tax=Paenibacillus polysaccharolyticus TaxID=582692 RepID=UPI00203F189F
RFFQRRSCKQDRYSLVVQFSKIKLVLATEISSFQQLLYNIMSEPTLQALFLVSFEAYFHLLAAPCKMCFLGRNKNIPWFASACKELF